MDRTGAGGSSTRVRRVSTTGSHRFPGRAWTARKLDSSAFQPPGYPKHSATICSARSLRFEECIVGVRPEPPGFVLEANDSASESPFSPVDRWAKLTGGSALAGRERGFAECHKTSVLRTFRTTSVDTLVRVPLRGRCTPSRER